MKTIIRCMPEDIPLGCVLEDDIKTDSGALFLKKGTTITEEIKSKVQKYKGFVRVKIEIKDNIITDIEKDTSFELSKEVKERARQGVEYMYNSKDTSEIINTAKDVSKLLINNIKESNSISINLSKLKICDDYTFKHSVDVATMATILGQKLNVPESHLNEITTAGILHDIGKIMIPTDILNKPGKLTDEEFNIIKQHTVYGYRIIQDSDELTPAIKKGVLMHHEKFHGEGYPLGIEGDQIHKIGRILSVVDVYDALVTERPYHDPHHPVEAYEMMLGMGNQFDLEYMTVFSRTVVLYPLRSIIELSNGVTGIVARQNKGYPARPVVKDVMTGKEYDLLNDINCRSIVII